MKCEECGGTGKVQKWFYERTGFGKYEKVCGDVKCEWCNGTGEVEQTEQEYIQTCNTEQLAEVIGNIAKNAYQCCQDGKTNKCVNRHNCTGYCNYGWEMWLKQPHTFK